MDQRKGWQHNLFKKDFKNNDTTRTTPDKRMKLNLSVTSNENYYNTSVSTSSAISSTMGLSAKRTLGWSLVITFVVVVVRPGSGAIEKKSSDNEILSAEEPSVNGVEG